MRHRPAFLIMCVLAAATAPPLQGAGVAVRIHRHGQNPASEATGTITAQSVADSSRSLVFPLPAASVPLPAGDWFLSAHIDGEWSEPVLVSVRESPQTAELNTFPLARLTARVTLASGKEPHELQAYFHRVSMEETNSPPEGNVPCEIAKGTATCPLPAGEFDLSFRIPGYVSRYRWNAALSPVSPFDAGTLHFVAGSTLSGRVEVPQHNATRLERIIVAVKPAAIAGANDQLRHRNESARVTAHPNKRGFFAFELSPGQFTIQASYNDLISEELKVDVSAGHEALLRQPLRLEPQRSVTIRLHPQFDPWSNPWTVTFASIDPTGVLLSERSLKTAPDGTCRFDNVLPGPHRLTIVRAINQSWASRTVDVDRDSTLDVDVRVLRMTGTIRIGTKPLAATAVVRSFDTGTTAVFRSKEDGTYAARLPAPEHDLWDEVEIRSDRPPLKRTLAHVQFHARDDGTAELNLDLPSRSITGTVVDEMGHPAAPALIDVLLPDGSQQQVDAADGTFTVSGLEPGRHRLRAATRERESVDLQEVSLGDDQDAVADVVLTVAPVGHLRGVIRAIDGPVLGAALYATRPGDLTRPIVLSRVDPDGRFDIRFPAGTPEAILAINAPGFAFRFTKTPLGEDEETFAVEQNGGMLSVDTSAARPGLRLYLVHGGAVLPAVAIAYVAGATFGANLSERVKFEIASIEPGAYSLCWVADGPATSKAIPPCISGVLTPNGSLTLSE